MMGYTHVIQKKSFLSTKEMRFWGYLAKKIIEAHCRIYEHSIR
jgi:hypothetical protein